MPEPQSDEASQHNDQFSEQVGTKAARKLRARREPAQGVWFGLGMMGMIGWSVVVPTLLGAALGLWLDSDHVGKRSWTLALMAAGLMLGCAQAWCWVVQESKATPEDDEAPHE